MKITLSHYQAANILFEDKDGGWTYKGAQAMINYLEELEDETDTEIDLDVVAIRCDYTEYNAKELRNEYEYILERNDVDYQEADTEEIRELILDQLDQETTVIKVDEDCFIIQAF